MTDTMRRIYQRKTRAQRHYSDQSGKLWNLQQHKLWQNLIFYDLRKPGQ